MHPQLPADPPGLPGEVIMELSRRFRRSGYHAPLRATIGSDRLDVHAIRVRGQRVEILAIGRDRGSIGLGECDDERVDGGPSPRLPAQQRSAPRQRFGNCLHDVARPEKAVREGVATSMPLQALDENDGGNGGRPEALFPQCKDQRNRRAGAFREPAHSAGVEHEHALTPSCESAAA